MGKDDENDYLYLYLLTMGKDDEDVEEGDNNLDEQ